MKETLWEVVRQGLEESKAISCRYVSKGNLLDNPLRAEEAGGKLIDTKGTD